LATRKFAWCAAEEDDSAEVYIGEEFIGVLFVDDEDEIARSSSRWPSSRRIWSIRVDEIRTAAHTAVILSASEASLEG